MNTVEKLIDYFVPSHYDLTIKLNESAHTFEGSVTITGSSTSDDHAIKLHAKDLEIASAEIDGETATFTAEHDDQLVVTRDDLTAGDHVITLAFSGTITDHMHGLYPCYYEQDGVKKELFATQFESHHAREAFPCIDEPAAKATFDVTLDTQPDQTVMSNMPISTQDTVDGRLVTRFETSPRMSTYLLAFVTGDLQRATAKTSAGVEVTVWATHAQPAASLTFALENAVKFIEFYDDYFGTPYPLPKSDHVALPDFSAGAMENWGLVTYREIALLADPTESSIDQRRHVALVIAHELAHQWFGNLVTMKWWNDLWLNESFATLMEYIAVDAVHPDWDIWLDFATQESIVALRRDSLDGVQPVQIDVNHPDEINTLFDHAIVYAKGARLLRMIQHYIGHDAFRAGLGKYFADHAYNNTVGSDLWDALSTSSGKQVASIMNAWISQPGFPVVEVTRDTDHVTLSQKQFFVGQHEDSDRQWPVPLDADDNGAPKLLDNPSITYPSSTPIRLNRADSAHFITHYDEMSRDNLISQVRSGELDTIGRVQLLDEATLLVRGGIMSSDQLLPLVSAYEDETLEPVWDMISLALAELRKFVEQDKDAETKLRRLSARLARKHYERLGWEKQDGESENDTKLRSLVIGMTLYGEVPEALAKAKELYENVRLEELDPELRPLIISSVTRYDDGEIVDKLLDAYISTQSSELKQDICIGVTSTRIPEKISELLDTMKNADVIKPQDVFRWFVYLIRSRDGRDITWQWLQDNWDWIEATFKSDKSYDDYPRFASAALVTREQLERFKEFFKPMASDPSLARAISVGVLEIEGRVELIERDQDAVVTALKALED